MALTAAERQRQYRARRKGDPLYRARRSAEQSASYRRHKVTCIARSQRWAEANRDRTRATWKAFYARHITAEHLRIAEKSRRREAQKRATALERVHYADIVRDAKGICALCEQPVVNEPAHIDHIVPLAKGGAHTYNNLQFTHARCNLAKGVKLLKKAG